MYASSKIPPPCSLKIECVERSASVLTAPWKLRTHAATAESIAEAFPLLSKIEAERSRAVHRFSVTQLINYQRCPRQYYFDRVLQLPAADQMAVWNNAEAPEPPANLTATLKGSVIHRFCERYTPDQSAEECLRTSFDEVLRLRQAQLADRFVEIDYEAAIRQLMPLARNYLASDVFKRVESAPKIDDRHHDSTQVDDAAHVLRLVGKLGCARPAPDFAHRHDRHAVLVDTDPEADDIESRDFPEQAGVRAGSDRARGTRRGGNLRAGVCHRGLSLGSGLQSGRAIPGAGVVNERLRPQPYVGRDCFKYC